MTEKQYIKIQAILGSRLDTARYNLQNERNTKMQAHLRKDISDLEQAIKALEALFNNQTQNN